MHKPLQEFVANLKKTVSDQKIIIDKNQDLHRVLGNTSMEPLIGAVNAYIADLQQLQKTQCAPGTMSAIADRFVAGRVALVRQQYNDFRRWSASFLGQREPEARKQLESYL